MGLPAVAGAPISAADINAKATAIAARSVQNGAFTAAAGTKYAVDATAGALTVTLPPSSKLADLIMVQKTDASANIVTISGTIDGATSTLPIRTQLQGKLFQGDGAGGWNIIAGDLSLPALDARFQAAGARAPLITVITYAATITPDASKGNTQRITATGNLTINAPTNPTEGQTICFEVTASGGGWQVTLQTGVAQSFSFPDSISSIPIGTSGKTQRIWVTYRSATARWEVVSVLGGY